MRERVLKAAADWVWVPPDAVDIVTDDYRSVTGRSPQSLDEFLAAVRDARR